MNNPPTSREELIKKLEFEILAWEPKQGIERTADFIIADREQREAELRKWKDKSMDVIEENAKELCVLRDKISSLESQLADKENYIKQIMDHNSRLESKLAQLGEV